MAEASAREPRRPSLNPPLAAGRLLEFATAAFLGALLVGGANMPKYLGFYLALLVFGFMLLRSPAAVLRASFASRLTLPLVGLLAAGVWGSVMSESAATSWTSFYRHDNLGMAILFGLMISHERPGPDRVRRLLLGVLVVFAGMNLWQIVHMARSPVFLDPAAHSYGDLWKTREFGEILILLAPFVWLIPVLSGGRWAWAATAAWSALVVLLLLPTGYRGAWVGFALGLAVWIVGRRRWKLVLWSAAGAALIAATASLLPGRNTVTQAVARGLDDNHRIHYIWKPTLEYVRQRPMTGYGFGQQIFIRALHADPRAETVWIKWMLSDPHSNTLAMQFAAGVPGTLAYGLLILANLLLAAKQARSGATELRRRSNLALLAAWAATFVSLGQLDIVNWNYLGFLLVLGVVLHRQQDGAAADGAPQRDPARRRVLFVIRDKLGDSLLAFATVQQYLRLRPGDDVTVLMRRDYAELVAGEHGFRLVRYRGGAQALLWALGRRLLAPPFDAVVVLRGFGDRVRKLGALLPARRRISFSGRLAPLFDEWPPAFESDDWSLVEPGFRAAAVLEPALTLPDRLDLPGLRRAFPRGGDAFVGVCPITDEQRKDLTPSSLGPLLDHIQRAHPGVPVKVLVREGAEALFDLGGRAGCELVNFRSLPRLCRLFAAMSAYYGADTGLYHLAAAMGIPATVVFGPTQPGRIILPRQQAASLRLEVLGEEHCDVKACRNPACIEQACANLGPQAAVIPLDATPAECPLRRTSDDARRVNRWHRYPRELLPAQAAAPPMPPGLPPPRHR
jgi:O-antigen ligase